MTNIDSWGCVTNENKTEMIERTNKYKKNLIDMAVTIKNIVGKYIDVNCDKDKTKLYFFLSDGTLLGAHRDGKMIEHDYDFDYGIMTTLDTMHNLFDFIEKELCMHNKTNGTDYITRIISDYSNKIEILDRSCGTYLTNVGEWYNVAVDLQLMCEKSDNPELIETQYFRDKYNEKTIHNKKSILPLGTITFENNIFPCPGDVKAYLEENYGCLEKGAVFDKELCKYIKPK